MFWKKKINELTETVERLKRELDSLKYQENIKKYPLCVKFKLIATHKTSYDNSVYPTIYPTDVERVLQKLINETSRT